MIARTRGYLPHIEDSNSTYFVTFRLYDSLPESVFSRYRQELQFQEKLKALDPLILLDQYEEKIQKYLDGSHGHCWLREPQIANLLADQISKKDNDWYILHVYTIMPNHVHAMISLKQDRALSEVIRYWKGTSAYYANKILKRSGTFWQREYFDRRMKTWRQFEYTTRYIVRNPVKAGLCEEIHHWPWTKASPEIQDLIRKFFL